MIGIFAPGTPASPIRWNWISLVGPDSRDFLHRLTTVDTKNLGPGQGKRGFFLTPQGKIRSYFHLWHYGPEEFAFELDDGAGGHWKKNLLEAIDQFTFGERFQLAEPTDLQWAWIFGDHDLPVAPGETIAIDDEIRIGHHGELDFGRPWVTAWGRGARLQQWIERKYRSPTPLDFEQLESWRIETGRPRVDFELTEDSSPLELGLRDAIAENKGCYPGQEVIEKIVSLGSPARRLCRVEVSTPVSAGAVIESLGAPPAELGTLTSVAPGAGHSQGLALLRKIHAKVGLEARIQGLDDAKARVSWVSNYA